MRSLSTNLKTIEPLKTSNNFNEKILEVNLRNFVNSMLHNVINLFINVIYDVKPYC